MVGHVKRKMTLIESNIVQQWI